MSTQAILTFQEEMGTATVFQHWDGYPSGIAENLDRTLKSGLVWALPRFDADEFAAGFIAANKTEPGGFRVLNKDTNFMVDYEYRVYQEASSPIMIEVTSYDKDVYKGTLEEFLTLEGDVENDG